VSAGPTQNDPVPLPVTDPTASSARGHPEELRDALGHALDLVFSDVVMPDGMIDVDPKGAKYNGIVPTQDVSSGLTGSTPLPLPPAARRA
jgi:hypothetical protein